MNHSESNYTHPCGRTFIEVASQRAPCDCSCPHGDCSQFPISPEDQHVTAAWIDWCLHSRLDEEMPGADYLTGRKEYGEAASEHDRRLSKRLMDNFG